MLVTGHQPNYLPYLGFVHKIALADVFVLVDNVQYVKRGPFGWIHRNRIRDHQGAQWLSVPILSKGKFTQQIRECRVNPRENFARKHARAITTNYSKAAHFDYAWPFFAPIFEHERWECFIDLAEAVIRATLRAFGIETPVHRASEIGAEGPAMELIASMCEKLRATRYLSGVHGRDYLDLAFFEARGISIEFQEFRHPVYRQCKPGPFVPYLSALDLVMNHGPDARAILMGELEIAPPLPARTHDAPEITGENADLGTDEGDPCAGAW